jgi:hypothetical protein
MDSRFIRVSKSDELRWSVLCGARNMPLLTFKLKSHAVAYARAVSYSSRLTLFVDDEHGSAVRQDAATLTYPRALN